jgi:hypothetical protein
MIRYSKGFKHIMLTLSMGSLLLVGGTAYGQENQSTVEVFFDEPVTDTGATYYIIPEEDLISNKVYSGAEMMTIDNKTFHFGMSESDVSTTMGKNDDDVVIVLYAGGGQQENQSERKIDTTIFRYKNDLLYELAIQGPTQTSEGNYYGWPYGKLKEELGDSTYVNTYDAMKESGLLVYKEKVGAKFFFFENGLVKEWGITNKDYRFSISWPLMYQTQPISFELGNSNGNIQNGGLITTENGWYYYAQPTDSGEHLYKMSSDGIIRRELSKDSARNINVKNGWLYYTNSWDWSNTGDGKIYRMKTDGSEREVISQIGATYLVMDENTLYFSTNGNGLELVPGVYKMDLNGDNLTLLDSGQSKFLNIIDEDLFYVIDKEISEEEKAKHSNDMTVTVDGVSAASQREDEPISLIRRMHISGDYSRDFKEGRFGFLLADAYGLYYADKDESYKAYVIPTDNEIPGQADLISSVPVVGMNRQDGFTYFQTIFNEYIVTNDLYGENNIKWKDHQVDQINVIGDKVFYQSEVDNKLSLYQKHQWQDDWKTITPTLVEGQQLTHAIEEVKAKTKTKSESEDQALTYYIPADKIHYRSNNWTYYDSVDMTIGRLSPTGYPEAEMVLQNAKIISAWNNDIYYTDLGFAHDGLYYINSDTKMVTKINNLSIKEGFIYKNLLVYSGKENGYLYKSDLPGHHVEALDQTQVKNIYVEDGWIYYLDSENQAYRMDLEGHHKEKLSDQSESK